MRELCSRRQLHRRFDKRVQELQKEIGKALKPLDKHESKRFLPGGRAEDLIREEKVKRRIKELFILDSNYRERERQNAWRRLRLLLRHGQDDTAADTFYRQICGLGPGREVFDSTRTKLFLVLILSGVGLSSTAWRQFVERCSHGSTSGARPFCDELLPLDQEQIEYWFGEESQTNDRILSQQYRIRPFIINGSQSMVSQHDILPYLSEKLIKAGEVDGEGVFEVEVDPANARDIPADPIGRKDVPHDFGAPHNRASEEDVDRILRAQRVMHRNILKVHGLVKFPKKLQILMELATESLKDHMRKNEHPGTALQTKIDWFEMIIGPGDALKFLHCDAIDPDTKCATPIRHGDLSPDNIVFVTDRDGRKMLKIADFGISCIGENKTRKPADQLGCCPPEFMERIFPAQKWTVAGDVWSYACVVAVWLVWLVDRMGEDKGEKGVSAFKRKRENAPSSQLELCRNRRFYIVEKDGNRSKDDPPEGRREGRDLFCYKRTDHAHHPVVLRLNPAVREYFDVICSDDDERPGWEKRFVREVAAALMDIALVPNPEQRGSMQDLLNALKIIIAEFRDND